MISSMSTRRSTMPLLSCIASICLLFIRPASAFSSTVNRPILPTTSLSASSTRSPSTTRHYSSSMDEQSFSSSDDNTDDDFMSSLRTRVAQVQDSSTRLPLVVLDTMLPRQVLRLQVKNPALQQLVRERLLSEEPFFGVMGMARLADGRQIYLNRGVEVRIDNPETIKGGEGMKLELVAGRRFEIEKDTVNNVEGGWTEARVKFFDSSDQEEEEVSSAKTDQDRMGVARAIHKADQFDSPSGNLENNLSLVDTWIQLARKNEREPNQIDTLLQDLGDMPPSDQPSERAMWIGALINPIPALGVSMEIRPRLLTAKNAEERVDVALEGMLRSIRHMDGSAKMW